MPYRICVTEGERDTQKQQCNILFLAKTLESAIKCDLTLLPWQQEHVLTTMLFEDLFRVLFLYICSQNRNP